jgi:hypothetical protein
MKARLESYLGYSVKEKDVFYYEYFDKAAFLGVRDEQDRSYLIKAERGSDESWFLSLYLPESDYNQRNKEVC